jgi:hypothetical protein
MEAVMINLYLQSGLFGNFLLIVFIVMAVNAFLSALQLFGRKNKSDNMLREYIKTILRAGIIAVAIGILGTLLGGYSAISVIRDANEVAMHIVWDGINAALSSTILGFEIFILSALIWFLLHMRYTMLNK